MDFTKRHVTAEDVRGVIARMDGRAHQTAPPLRRFVPAYDIAQSWDAAVAVVNAELALPSRQSETALRRSLPAGGVEGSWDAAVAVVNAELAGPRLNAELAGSRAGEGAAPVERSWDAAVLRINEETRAGRT
jgi:hypothetical protein